jgi:hypothetical protein
MPTKIVAPRRHNAVSIQRISELVAMEKCANRWHKCRGRKLKLDWSDI